MTDTLTPGTVAARFRPPQTPPSKIVWTTDPSGWAALDEMQLAELPAEGRRTLAIAPGVYVTLVKCENGSFTLLHRKGIQARALAGMRTAPRVPIDPAQCPGE